MAHFVIVGAGQAAASLAARLRAKGFDGDVTIIGEEPVAPYQRPPLSKKYLTGEMELDRLFLRPDSFYVENNIKLKLGMAVEALDPAARTVTVAGDAIEFDKLSLTTGSRPRLLPKEMSRGLSGIYPVRTLADVDAMAPEFEPGRRALIVGGGYIGLEAAAVAATRGLKVTLVEMAPRILQRVASEETAAYFRELHRAHGVEILEETGLVALTGDSHVTGAEFSTGAMRPFDFVVVGIGIVPNTALADGAGLAVENGICVDARCQTSARDIFAAGDCASFPHGAERLRLESVGNAIDMGEAAADAMLGGGTDYSAKPWFWSDQYDVTLQIAGLSTGYTDIVTRKDGERVAFWYYRDSRLIAVDAMKDAKSYMMGKRWIEAGLTPDPDQIADPSANFKQIPVS